MNIIVDYDQCEAKAVCMDCCAEVFPVEERDTLTLLMDEAPENLCHQLDEAVLRCARQALRIEG